MLDISSTITSEQVEQAIHRLPNGKAPGPDGIPNEVLRKWLMSSRMILLRQLASASPVGRRQKPFANPSQ
jgi:hypothetical protein